MYAFGVLPTAAIVFLSVVLSLVATARYVMIFRVLIGSVRPVADSREGLKMQWFYTAASVVSAYALYVGAPLFVFCYFITSAILAIPFLTYMTVASLKGEGAEEEA